MEMVSRNETAPLRVLEALLHHTRSGQSVFDAIQRTYRLTPTQTRVAVLLADRLTNDEVAQVLCVKESTARRHTEAVLLRLNVTNRFQVISRLADFFLDDVA